MPEDSQKQMLLPKLKLGERVYEKERLSLGEMRQLKHLFGVETFSSIDFDDPDVLVGLMFLCRVEQDPKEDRQKILEEIESIDVEMIADAVTAARAEATEAAKREEAEATGPPPVAAAEDVEPMPPGISETTPAASGTPS